LELLKEALTVQEMGWKSETTMVHLLGIEMVLLRA